MTQRWVRLCTACIYPEDECHVCGTVARDGICARCGDLAVAVFLRQAQDPRPAVGGGRHLFFSTSTAIDKARRFIADTNGYYRELGVDPHASRREIREAYQRAQGWNSARLTYIVAQLLDDQIRRAYDLAHPGQVFIDRYVIDAVHRRLAAQMGGVSGKPVQVVDKPVAEGHDDATFRWGHFLWQSGCTDRARLTRWQEHVVNAFAERKEIRTLAVGFCGSQMGTVEVSWDGTLPIVLLNEREQPTASLAREAADRVDHNLVESEIDL